MATLAGQHAQFTWALGMYNLAEDAKKRAFYARRMAKYVAAAPLSIADLIEPKKVKTVSVRPDGTLLPNDAPPQVTAAAVPVPAATPKSAGSHEIWYSPTTRRKFSVPRNMKMVHTANGILKSAGLPKAF
jgi:hypothetical protein